MSITNINKFIKEAYENFRPYYNEHFRPTYTVDLANLLVDLSQTDNYGTYHVTNEEYCSWADFAKYIFEYNHKDVKVKPVSTEEYLRITGTKQAYRPRNSKLDKSKLDEIGLHRLPTWKDAVERYSKELEEEQLVLRRFK